MVTSVSGASEVWKTAAYAICVIWFVSHVLQFLPIRFTQQNLWCISRSMMETYVETVLVIGPFP